MAETSNIYALNRVLGYVSNDVPLKIRYIKKRRENLIVTCVEKSFYTWSSSRFSLLSVSPLHDQPIRCFAADNFLIFTASGNDVYAWRRGTELKQTYTNSSKTGVHLMLPFGPHLIGIDEANVLTVWDIKSQEIYLELNFPVESFRITKLCHPPSYVNKILLGSEQGSMQLRNIKSSKLVYSFTGWDSPITALTPAPALDIVAVGLQNGKILLHNIKFDETLTWFVQDWGPVVSLSFRTDGQPIMASASSFGHIVFWNLDESKVDSQLLNAHYAGVTGMEFLPSEPLLVTSSPDNSLKLWIFDKSDGGARLLRIREGHAASPSFIRFYGLNGEHILSTGSDGYLRAFNTTTEIANKNLGRAVHRVDGKKVSVRKIADDMSEKMPAITQFAFESTREKEWDNIAAIHRGTSIISTWSFGKCKFGSTLISKNSNLRSNSRATSIFITHCGNFVLVGYKTGELEKFNIQSGLFRGSYGQPKAHESSVNGIVVNNVNQLMVTGSADHFIKFWSFKQTSRTFLHQMDVDEPVLFVRNHSENNVIAVALEDYSILILDIDFRTVIRKFSGHSAELTDCCFNPDGRWLVSASMDSTVQTWDVPSGQCVDSFKVEKPCVSVTFCPTGFYLATAHVDQLGVTLWTNRTIFSLVSIGLPNLESLNIGDSEKEEDNLITLATNAENCPASNRWQTILQIDRIRERNAAKEVVKKREAPFILPLIPAVETKFDLSAAKANETKTPSDRILHSNQFLHTSIFAQHLRSGDYEKAAAKIKSLSPSLVNFEIASLSSDLNGAQDLMLHFLKMLEAMLKSKKHFELSSSYLALFLKNYSTVMTDYPVLYDTLNRVSNLHNECWNKLQKDLIYCIGVSKFLSDN